MGLQCYFTMDAGPNVKILCPSSQSQQIHQELQVFFLTFISWGMEAMPRYLPITSQLSIYEYKESTSYWHYILSPGKIVLAGEYAVLDGCPSIVLAINRGVCRIQNGSGISTPNQDVRFVIDALLEHQSYQHYAFPIGMLLKTCRDKSPVLEVLRLHVSHLVWLQVWKQIRPLTFIKMCKEEVRESISPVHPWRNDSVFYRE